MSGIKLPVVATRNGRVKGRIYTTVFGREIYAFHRIPYIKKPIGDLRFKDPQPVGNWAGIVDGTTDSMPLPNINEFSNKYEGDETSVFINVYTKYLEPQTQLPVMVFFHGGGFVSGSGSTQLHAPDFLMQNDIVLFTFNYRIGALGFLSFDNPKYGVPGNAGIKDQNMALRWINDNCSIFGGDPNNITVFGESAGAALIHCHMMCDRSKGLFHKAILMSGCILNNWALVPNFNFTLRLAAKLGWFEDEGEDRAFEILQSASAESIVEAQELLTYEEKRERLLGAFGPIIEPYISEQTILGEPLVELMKKQWSHSIPVIIGHTSDEGLFLYASVEKIRENPHWMDELEDFEYIVPRELVTSRKSEECRKQGLKLRNYYYGNEIPTLSNLRKYYRMMADKIFHHGLHTVIINRSRDSCAPTYLYRFSFDSPTFNHFKIHVFKINEKGVCHADDLSYLFKNVFYELSGFLKISSPEYKTIQRMVDMWTSFAACCYVLLTATNTLFLGIPQSDCGGSAVAVIFCSTTKNLVLKKNNKVWCIIFPLHHAHHQQQVKKPNYFIFGNYTIFIKN